MQSKLVSLLFAVVVTCLLNIVGLYWSRLSHGRSEDSRVLTMLKRQLSLWQWDDHDRERTEQQKQEIGQSQIQVSEISQQHFGQTTESQEDSMIVVREANMGVDKKETEAWVSESTDSESERERTANLTNGVEEAYDPSAKYESTEKVVDSKQLQGSQVEEKLVQNTTVSEKKGPDLEVSVSASFNAGNFNLPVPFATLPQGQLLQVKWIQELRDYLNTVMPDSGPVTIVSSDYSYREILLNWLISALVRVDRSLSNVLVLSLDSSLHALLQGKGFACIHVPPDQLLRSVVINRLALTGHVAFTQVHILRLTVMRLVNHWGFDVANYDIDAIILKNPEPLYYKQYRDSDFIGSYGHSPLDIKQEWGIAICIGAMMIRSSKNTEQYWESMSKVLPEDTNDQVRLNVALKAMNVKWSNSLHGSYISILKEAWQGKGVQGFTVTVLPSTIMCRARECRRRYKSSYYVWHRGGKHEDGKRKYAAGAGLWYLRTDWMTISNGTITNGLQWLKAITK